jgi:Na+-transporting methylmalonyl-CoA/oxaloacetate decarboxylase gamma subunit
METTVRVIPSGISIIATIISLLVLGVGIYLLFLLVKALRIYIKKNS